MLNVFNTLSRFREEFQPAVPERVTLYQCGPTVYWTQHIGNLRAAVLADLIVRSLRYLGHEVTYVRNYTDVGHLASDADEGEDRMARGAVREGLTPEAIAAKYIQIFEADTKALNVDEPGQKPRATAYIPQMIDFVTQLIEKDYAYATDLAVYFDISKARDYTRLSGQDLSANIAQAGRGEVTDPAKRQSADFALWFFKAGTHASAIQTWPTAGKLTSPLVADGEGFPGWHIECSAMIRECFHADTIDIHMGGIEHIPVHHTNEIAQSEALTGAPLARYWLHNEHLTVDGTKMSKSAGTTYSLAELVDKGYDPLALRYFYLQAHYRSKQNFTDEALDGARNALTSLRQKCAAMSGHDGGSVDEQFKQAFVTALEDDFNIPQALAVVWDVLKSDRSDADKLATILDFDRVLGLGLASARVVDIPADVRQLADERWAAKQAQDWARADELRSAIEAKGFAVDDGADHYTLKSL